MKISTVGLVRSPYQPISAQCPAVVFPQDVATISSGQEDTVHKPVGLARLACSTALWAAAGTSVLLLVGCGQGGTSHATPPAAAKAASNRNHVADIPYDTAGGFGHLIIVTDRTQQAVSEKIDLIRNRAAQLDGQTGEVVRDNGGVDAYLPSRANPQEHLQIKTDGGKTIYEQTIIESHGSFMNKSVSSHTERFIVSKHKVRVEIEDSSAEGPSVQGKAIQFENSSHYNQTQAFEYTTR